MVLSRMNEFGRVSICGAISGYNALEPPKGTCILFTFMPWLAITPSLPPSAHTVSGLILWKQLKVEGFLVPRWLGRWGEAFKELAQWIQEVGLAT